VHKPLLQTFPFPSTLGEVTLHPLSQACMFIYSSQGKWVFPPLLFRFPPTATFTSSPAFSGWFVMRDFPSPPSLLRVFFVVIAYYLGFFSFFPGWGSVCPGGYTDLAQGCLWEYHIPLSSPCGLHLPTHLGAAVWRQPGALLVSPFNVKRRLEVWRSQSFTSSCWFFL
jgi:hypothetical protein